MGSTERKRQAQLQRIRMRKSEALRHLRLLEQRVARNPRDLWARREIARVQELVAELEEQEKLLSGAQSPEGGEGDGKTATQSENLGRR